MRNHELARRYAKSLIDVACETGQLEAVEKDVKYLKDVCAASTDFVRFLKNPSLHHHEKMQVIEVLFKGKTTGLTLVFLRLLVKKHRESYLPQIIDVFFESMRVRNGVHVVKLTTAIAVSDALQQKVLAKVQAETRLSNLRLECFVDEGMIGGLILEYDGKMVDASLQKSLRQLAANFENVRLETSVEDWPEHVEQEDLVLLESNIG